MAVYLGSFFASSVVAAGALRLWRADLGVPFFYGGDAWAVLDHFVTVKEQGWYEYQPRLGAPFGQTFHDFPTADNLHLLVAKIIFLFTSSPAAAMNIYYLIGFPLAALAMTWLLRTCRVSRSLTIAFAVLFSVLPYHFFRNEAHLWLASYYPVASALVIVIWAATGQALWRRGRGGRWLGLVTGRGVAAVVALALVGTASSYYGLFILITLTAAGVASLVRTRALRRFGGVLAAVFVLALTMFLNMLPDLLYSRANGTNSGGFSRSIAEAEVYGLKISGMILPVPGHRLAPLATIRQTYDSKFPLPSEPQALGMIASIGLVVILVAAVLGVPRLRKGVDTRTGPRRLVFSGLVSATLLCVLMGTIGGFASVVAFVNDSLRGWNRISIVIGALSLAAMGVLASAALDRLFQRFAISRGSRVLVSLLLSGALLVVGCLDQVTNLVVPTYQQTKAQYEADARFFGEFEQLLPRDSMVFQLPYQPYPEAAPVNGVWVSEQTLPFIHTSSIRWSGGAIQGRARADWDGPVSRLPAKGMVRRLAAADFAGILIDRRAMGADVSTEADLRQLLGDPVVVDPVDRWAFYSLSSAREELAADLTPAEIEQLARSTTEPVMAYPGHGFESSMPAGVVEWTLESPPGAIVIDNAASEPRSCRVSLFVAGGGEPSISLRLGVDDWQFSIPQAGRQVTITLVVPPGRSELVVGGAGGATGSAGLPIVVSAVSVEVDPNQ